MDNLETTQKIKKTIPTKWILYSTFTFFISTLLIVLVIFDFGRKESIRYHMIKTQDSNSKIFTQDTGDQKASKLKKAIWLINNDVILLNEKNKKKLYI